MEQPAPPPRLHTGSVRFMSGPDGKHSKVQRIDAKDLDLNLLVMAKQEYTSFLHSILRDKVKGGLLTQYHTAVEESPSPLLIIKTYQKILKETPLWNQNIVKKETERILGDYRAMFPNLIALIYVAKVKIMASVWVTKGTSYVALSIPSPEAFIHQVYIECAHVLYNNPFLCHLPSSDVHLHFQRNDVLQDVVRRGTEEALSIMLPVKDILSEYLNNTMLENSVFSMGEEDDREDSSSDDETEHVRRHEEDDRRSDEDAPQTPRKYVPPVGDDFLKQALVRPMEETRVVHTDPRNTAPASHTASLPPYETPPPMFPLTTPEQEGAPEGSNQNAERFANPSNQDPANVANHTKPVSILKQTNATNPTNPTNTTNPTNHSNHANPTNAVHMSPIDRLEAGSEYFEDENTDDDAVVHDYD
jgi:hypothetical protein